MNKLYLLPISLFLLNPGFAAEQTTNPQCSAPKIVSEEVSKSRKPEIILINNRSAALEIDPRLVEELKEEIAALMEKNSMDQEELISSDAEQEISSAMEEARIKSYSSKRAKQEPVDEVTLQEETVKIPKFSSEPSATADQDVQQPVKKKQGPHVRRYSTQSAKSPKTPEDKENADAQQEQRVPHHRAPQSENQRPKARPKQSQPAKTPRTYPNTVDAEDQHSQSRKQPASKVQESTADADFEHPAQPQKKSPMRSQAQTPHKKIPRQQTGKNTSYETNDAYMPLEISYEESDRSTRNHSRIAQTDNSPSPMNQQNQMGMHQNDHKKVRANTPVRPMVENGYDFWLMGDVLLWQAVEENLTYVYTGNGSNRTLHTVDFDWDWGFRLGAGYNMPRDGWDLDLYWSHIRNNAHAHKHADLPETSLFQVWTTASDLFPGTANEAESHWHIHLDQLDLDLGRQFYVGKHLSIRPYAGLRSAWIFQKYKVEVTGTAAGGASLEQEAELKNRFWGFGFVAGMDSDWQLGWGISLYGEADMSILLGFFDIDQKGEQNDSSIWSQDKSFRAGRAIMDLGLGLKWARLFYNDRFGLTLKGGYEYHLYFNQNQFILSNGNSSFELFNPVNGDLVYQGVIGSIQFDF